MTDPEEQLRRLAEGRAQMVGPFTADHLGRGEPSDAAAPEVAEVAEVIELTPRRWPAAVAAACLAIAAAGAGVFAVFAGPDGIRDDEAADSSFATIASAESTESSDIDDDTSGGDVEASATSTTAVVPDVSIPDVVGDAFAEAAEEILAAGLEVELGSFYVEGGDPRLGEVVEATADGALVELVVARLAPSLRSTDPCQRPAYLLGSFDDDLLVDRVFPRFTEGRITEIEICTGSGVRAITGDLDLHRIELVADIDLDGRDELVVSVDPAGAATRVLAFVDGALTELVSAGGIDIGLDDLDPVPECLIHEPDVALLGDVDGDGTLDRVSLRDGIACLDGGPVVDLGDLADDAGVWFLDDIDDDGALEVFVGQTTAETMTVRPYSISSDGTITPAAEEDCCVQTTPAAAAALAEAALEEAEAEADGEAESGADPDAVAEPARWFSCIAGRAGAAGGAEHGAELIAGRYWIDVETGVVTWTVDVGSEADADRTYAMTFDDPLATDAWIPGNGCRNSSQMWITPATIEFGDDGTAVADSVAEFNASIAGDDPGRRLVRLRQALGIADQFGEADGPYRESIAEGWFELAGLHDDSGAATRWTFEFSDDGSSLVSISRSWACRPGRGHHDFSTESCL